MHAHNTDPIPNFDPGSGRSPSILAASTQQTNECAVHNAIQNYRTITPSTKALICAMPTGMLEFFWRNEAAPS